MRKPLVLLGSTGSIGTQALDVARALGLRIEGLAANQNIRLLEQQAREFLPRRVAVRDKTKYQTLKTALSDTSIEVTAGEEAVDALAAAPGVKVLNSVVGIAGLSPTLAAIDAGNDLALANKETLVAAGELVMRRAAERNIALLPVDSEHSAIFQCLNGENRDRIERVLLTASGGPFFGRTREELLTVTAEDALRHPNWSMGAKITVDSATLMNKGLELIEAMRLFSLPSEKITVMVHRQSIVHSAVEFQDGAVIAQLGAPDMRLPIQYALTYPERRPCPGEKLSLFDCGALTFERPDEETFPCLALAKQAAARGGLAPCVLNGANEAAVSLFLMGKLSFPAIAETVGRALETVSGPDSYGLSDVLAADRAAREFVLSIT